SALIDAGSVGPRDAVFCENGTWRIGSRPIRDHRPHGLLTLAQVIEVSSNIGIAKFARRLPPPAFHAALRRLGLGEKTGVDLPAESAGMLRSSDEWKGADHESIAFGHAIAVTVLQLGASYAALSNDGVWVRPRITRAWGSPDGTWHATPPAPTRAALQSETARRVARMMRRVIDGEHGTGRSALVPGVAVAGKTGTAEKVIAGRYDRSRNVTSFAGFAPVDDPSVVVVVSLDEPNIGGRTAAATTAPVFARVMEETLRLRRVPPARPGGSAPLRLAVDRRHRGAVR
ncbi:MAG: penicillin-binding transpeptidase domain-containing protein, partial [Acidobacteriota bacterium]|nr:penicillin-binding transpeptidase domain-containing protein [Acidobacteriota bacterium]